jgi:hypothetical protein
MLATLTQESHIVRLELAGYQPSETKLEKSLNPWVFGNILVGGLVGVVIDVVTGGFNQLNPDGVDSTLGPATAPQTETDAAKVNVTLRTVQNRQ